jgi:hypothetical protein
MKYIKQLALVALLLSCAVACGTMQSSESSLTTPDASLVVTTVGKENDDCKLSGVDFDTLGVDEDGEVGFNLGLSDNYAVTGSGSDDDSFEAVGSAAFFELYDANGDQVSAEFSLSPEMQYIDVDMDSENAGEFVATNRANLFVSGLSNPADQAIYTIVIPAGAITCEKCESTTADN